MATPASRPHPHTDETTRIVPAPPPSRPDEVESDATWGFTDTAFAVDSQDRVVLTGARYSLAGQPLPTLLPWIRGVMQIDFDPKDRNEPAFPPAVAEPRANAAFDAALAEFLRPDQVSTDAMVRLRRGHGHTQDEMYNLKHGQFSRLPDRVIFPETEEHVARLVAIARDQDVVLIPYGGGTNVTQALRCPEGEARLIAVIDMQRMNRIRWIDPKNRMACIEAGAVGRHLTEQLREHGFILGHEPDSIEFSTLGGWIATRASGMKKNRYGNIEDIVLDLTAVTAHGTLERRQLAPRESTGLDAREWMFGSEGTLGIVTSAVVKLFPVPQSQVYDSVIFKTFTSGVAFMYDLAQSGDWPASARLVDNLQFQFSIALKPASTGFKAIKSKLEKSLVTGVMGFDPQEMVACTLVFEGTHEDVERQRERVKRLAKQHGGMIAGGENGSRGYQLTFGIAYIRDWIMDHWLLAESFETSIPWSKLEPMVEAVKKRLYAEHERRGLPGKPFVTARVTQIYESGAAVYFYLAYCYKGVSNPTGVFHELEDAAREEILAHGGSLSHHHGIGKLRQGFLPAIASSAALAMQAAAKKALDPTNIFGNGNQTAPMGQATAPHGGSSS